MSEVVKTEVDGAVNTVTVDTPESARARCRAATAPAAAVRTSVR